MTILRTIGILIGLATLSFILGFFVLGRLVPGSSRPAMAASAPLDPTQPVFHKETPAATAPKPKAGTTEPAHGAAPTAPGPSLDASNDPPTASAAAGVQEPLKSDGSKDAADQSSSGDSAAVTPRDKSDAGAAPLRPKRKRRPVVNPNENDAVDPAAADDAASGGDSTTADDREPAVIKPKKPHKVRTDEQDSQPGGTDQAEQIRPSRNRSTDTLAPAGTIYHVHLGSFHSRDAADQEVERARSKGFETQVVPIVRNGRTLYRVQAGAFRERSRAESVKQSLQDASLDASVSEQKR